MINNSVPENDCAIYINHTIHVHYDIVLDVSTDFNDNQCNYVNQTKYKFKEGMHFSPVDSQGQRFVCSLVNLPLLCEHSFVLPKNNLMSPKFYRIQGDGNGLFRALS